MRSALAARVRSAAVGADDKLYKSDAGAPVPRAAHLPQPVAWSSSCGALTAHEHCERENACALARALPGLPGLLADARELAVEESRVMLDPSGVLAHARARMTLVAFL